MRKLEFKFDIDQEVVTPFGDKGLITMLGFDEGGNKVFVQTATDGAWFKEKQISLQNKEDKI